MKIRIAFLGMIAVSLGILVGAYQNAYAQYDSKEKEQLILFAVQEILDRYHFQETPLDDEFSKKAFKVYLNRLDNNKRFLIQEDLDLLDDYEEEQDDALKNHDLKFFNISYDVINNAVKRVEGIYPKILNSPFDFTIDEDIELDPEKREYPADEEELYATWEKFLKYETLNRLADKLKEQEKAEEPEGGKKSMAELEQEAREATKKMIDDWFERIHKLRRSDRFELYLNSLTNIFDPHTDYFNPKEKEDFNINMSGRLEGIGARLQTDGDYTKVVHIVPGGPAWKQGELMVDDLISKVKQVGEEPVNVTGMHIDDVVSQIRGKKGTLVTLTVKKVDGTFQDIIIERDEVLLDEGLARSLILDNPEKGGKIGYIHLPRFYADFENPNGRSCAQDVEKELEKLKAKNVDGVILDLRNNSGGSLNDVVEMSGLFIEKGPIVQVKSRVAQPQVLEDKDPDVVYDGPLVVMVNAYSASASEILAAALQDYDRALIVGSPSTFGKGTVQRFFDLDRVIRDNEDAKPLGELKFTVQKFYRINGGSTQLKGVQPDIVLPDNFSFIEVGEKQMDYPLEWTEIDKLKFEQHVKEVHDIDKLANESSARITKDPTFQRVLDNARRLKELRDDTDVSLHFEKYRAEMEQRDLEAEEYKDLFQEISDLQVQNLPEDMNHIELDSSRIARNDSWLETVKKDIYIDETMAIMNDMRKFN